MCNLMLVFIMIQGIHLHVLRIEHSGLGVKGDALF